MLPMAQEVIMLDIDLLSNCEGSEHAAVFSFFLFSCKHDIATVNHM